jgi:glycerol-3-phosphate dehydrogenase
MSLRRDAVFGEIAATARWDVLVIGGGATGLGAAVEAASRGYRTLLIEKYDFAKGTSSRSTKLVHGGVRYLQQANLTLVLDALRERGYMLRNAPHIVHRMQFVVPVYSYGGLPYYGFGLKMYEWLSGKLSFGRSEILSVSETVARLPTIRREGLKGGILYRDGQFDDARYAISLMRTLEDVGGHAANYIGATGLIQQGGKTVGVTARDGESAEEMEIFAKVVINATGVFTEEILRMDEPGKAPLLTISQGSHFVLPKSFLPSASALMIPETSDGRVLFAIPWHERLVVGTTDEAVPGSSVEPHAMRDEQAFLIDHIERFLGARVGPSDVLSMWSGLRPLVREGGGSSSRLSRDHKVLVSGSGLITVTGGKWTTYRRMGEDAIDKAAELVGLAQVKSRTAEMPLHGFLPADDVAKLDEAERVYGSDAAGVKALDNSAATLHADLPYRACEVVWAARYEMARTVEDVLARRTRALFLNARAAREMAPAVATLLATELGRDAAWQQEQVQSFNAVADGYIYRG